MHLILLIACPIECFIQYVFEWYMPLLLLLLLLSRFSRVQLCATPKTAAHQAPPSLGFSRQEHWSRLPFPSPVHESEVTQLCPTLSDPVDCSLTGSSVHGIGCHCLLRIDSMLNHKISLGTFQSYIVCSLLTKEIN